MPNIDAKLRQRLGAILRTGYLRNILIVSVCIAIVFPIADRFFIYPLFYAFVIENTEVDAIRTAEHLAHNVTIGPHGLTKESLPSKFIQKADYIARTLGLMKFKVFSRSGETLFSTVPEDIGRINEKPYFRDIVAKGGVYTKLVRKDTKTSEGPVATLDVVETYYPISSDGGFAGAFEIYYDITGRIAKIDRLLFVSSIILAGVASGLLIVVVWTLSRAVSATLQRDLSESRFKDFAEGASDWFWEMDENLAFTYHSPRYFEITGFRPEDKIGTTRTRYVDPADLETDADNWAAHMEDLEARRPFKNFEFAFKAKDGATINARISGIPVFDAESNFQGYRGTGSDISERKRAEAELRKAQDDLVRQERLAVLGKLSATVSHELRNPLGTIRTSMITITDNTEGRGLDVEGAIERIVRNIKRCNDIIGELLDYTRDTAPNREPTDVDEWLGGVLDEQDTPTGLSIERDLASGIEATFDRDRMRRAVINVYDNACQAVQENGDGADKEVVIATKVNGKRVEIQVTDSGPGIPDDELGKIFEPLYSTRSFGVGLGLPVVQKIVEEHGGGIDIASPIGRGTRVTLWLPLAAPEQSGNATS